MIQLALLKLILYKFLTSNVRIRWLLLFNCWDLDTQLNLTEMLMVNNFYMQMRNINHLNSSKDLGGNYIRHGYTQLGIFFDFNCQKSEEFLKKASKETLFSKDFMWLIYDEKSNITKFRELFENVQMAVDAEIIYAIPNIQLINIPENSTYLTYDVYNNGYKLGGKLNMTKDREILCSQNGCQITKNLSNLHENTKFLNRWTLKDITMRVTAVVTYLPLTLPEEKLLSYLGSTENMHLDGIARIGFHYMMILKDSIEFKARYNFTNAWSITEFTGGCVGALGIEKAADLSSSVFLPSLTRYPYVHPVMPLGTFRQVCIFRTPHNAGIRSDVYLEPFASKSWIVFASMLLLIGFLLWFVFTLECRKLKKHLSFSPSLLTSCLLSFGSACCQGSFIVPASLGGRVIFFTMSLLTFIIYNYYTSIVVAILLGSPVKSNIKTMGQLADSNLEVAMEPVPYTRAFLNFSTEPDIRRFARNKITSRKNPDSVWLPTKEGIKRVREEPGFVYGTEALSSFRLIMETYTDQEICDINEVLIRPVQVLHSHLPANSSYRELFRIKEVRILECGLHHRVQHLWIRNRLRCDMTNIYLMQVGLEYTAPLFLLLVGSYILVILMLIAEILWHKFMPKF